MSEEAAHKVLVIDDELGPRESIRFLLKGTYEVFCADSVDQGVAMLREQHPDLVIMDIRMPRKSGIEGLREIREHDKVVSVVMLTGYGALETAQEALRLGATDYLSKPFDTTEMLAAVKRYVDRTRHERRRTEMMKDLQEINSRLVDDLASKEQQASMAQSTAEIAHDMRNPLMIVSGYVELLTNQLESVKGELGDQLEGTDDYLEVIGQNVRRCCDLSHMWQKYGRAKLNEFCPTTLTDVIEDIVVGAAPLAASENVSINYDMQPDGAVINGNKPQLLRAIHNVVANAIQAVSPPEGGVQVSCRCGEGRVDIVVRDNGSGMTPEVLNHIFEPYYTTKEEGKGTGLGMVITKRIIEEHQGELLIDSTPGEGTTVTIRLPLATTASEAVSSAA
ncbi:MAG: hybrid sensor histidine kinase/response regulator [Verrucomicrobia bacterium]|jgi:signal transduction histidine kinase|nr:hybrid sensor histidine kinase/response regulator [Verrucomicrobiota bacterium]MBT7069079.1 hybrid sensor histidine kinase/response regulator [Verrucomicrobiota bacterium]MBT7700538.1 hybrid sensor histidine kinase/response regulator [Verrucomicrobiota bacterium]